MKERNIKNNHRNKESLFERVDMVAIFFISIVVAYILIWLLYNIYKGNVH